MKRAARPTEQSEERSREQTPQNEAELRAKSRRQRVAEAQKKILATYAETFRRLAE